VLAWVLEQREQRQEQQDDDHPEGEIAQIGIHPWILTAAIGAAAVLVSRERSSRSVAARS
jgi:hypothetical protein